MAGSVSAVVKIEAQNKHEGLTLADLRKLVDETENAQGSTKIRVRVGWKSQLVEITAG